MSQDGFSERNIEIDKPSTSQPSESQAADSRHSRHSRTIINTKSHPETVSTSINNSCQDGYKENSTAVFNDYQMTNLSDQYHNIDINNDNDVAKSSSNTPKKKNARKKERLKKLHIEMPNDNQNQPVAIQTAPAGPVHNGIAPVHDFFLKQITPLYASTSSRYLENLTHHPQFHLMQNIHFSEMFQNHQTAASLPSTPFLQQPHSSNPQNFQNLALLHQHTPPKFLQNALQHPLLSKNFVHTNHHNFHQASPGFYPVIKSLTFVNSRSDDVNTSPRRRNRQKNKDITDTEERQFNVYMSKEEVEKGIQNNVLLEGVLRINPKQFQLSYVSSNDRSEQDVLIDGIKNRNRALEGDVVVVQYIESDEEESTETNGEDKQKKGKVVYIKEKVHTRTCIGTLKLMPDRNRQKALFTPRDHRIPRLNIPFTNWPDNFYKNAKSYANTLFLAKIEEWSNVKFALGKILCNIGQSGDMQSETKAILAQTDLDITPFGPEVRHLYPRLDYIIPEEEIKLREDCRKMCIFSIDPFNCRDIDDAVSCEILENGNYEIGVHISDVAHFLTENTILDEKVAEKATTIYMVERAYHMLPDDLCMLCSLFPGVDKLAFSVFWEMTEDAIVIKHRFAKTVIQSCCQLAYDHAQAVLDNVEDAETTFPEFYNGFNFKDIQQRIKILGKLSAILRKKRFGGGALRLDQPKVSFHLSPTNGLPESYWIYESKESHQLIEEFMLLSNMTVAQRIHDDHPQLAFLRCHPSPSLYMLKQLAKSLKPMGINLEIESAGELYKSLLPYIGPESTDRGKVMVLNMLCAKPMTRAKYFCIGGPEEDHNHYALNVPLYTHFTSPIRRYADIMVHRYLFYIIIQLQNLILDFAIFTYIVIYIIY